MSRAKVQMTQEKFQMSRPEVQMTKVYVHVWVQGEQDNLTGKIITPPLFPGAP
jgi:hypothetical protein